MWERIKLPANYIQALEKIDSELEFWPKFLLHKCKQRLTKIHQYLMRMRRLKLTVRTKLVGVSKKLERREVRRELKAEKVARLNDAISAELVARLKSGTYENSGMYLPPEQFEEVLDTLQEDNQDPDLVDEDDENEERQNEDEFEEADYSNDEEFDPEFLDDEEFDERLLEQDIEDLHEIEMEHEIEQVRNIEQSAESYSNNLHRMGTRSNGVPKDEIKQSDLEPNDEMLNESGLSSESNQTSNKKLMTPTETNSASTNKSKCKPLGKVTRHRKKVAVAYGNELVR